MNDTCPRAHAGERLPEATVRAKNADLAHARPLQFVNIAVVETLVSRSLPLNHTLPTVRGLYIVDLAPMVTSQCPARPVGASAAQDGAPDSSHIAAMEECHILALTLTHMLLRGIDVDGIGCGRVMWACRVLPQDGGGYGP